MGKHHGRPRRLLIVDDEQTLVFFLRQGLQESEIKWTVDGTSSSEDALTKLTYNRYDVLITDLKMPGISGFTLVEVARSLQPDIGVIVMTAFGSHEVQDEAVRLKVDGYLTKPFPTAKLQEMVMEILTARNGNEQHLVSEQNYSSSFEEESRTK